MNYITSITSITTSDAIQFLNRWVAVVCMIVTFVILSFAFWKLLFTDYHDFQPSPYQIKSQPPSPSTLIPQPQTHYFNGIAISNPSTNFNPFASTDITETVNIEDKCKLFGNDCLGYDTLGSLFLTRDKGIATLNGLKPGTKGGFYAKISETQAKLECDKLKGVYNQNDKECTDINRIDVKNWQFFN